MESHEPGSTTYNAQLWRRSRNEKIVGETQTQAEIAGKCKVHLSLNLKLMSAFPADCEWDRPVSTVYATGTPLKLSLHAFDTLLVSANDYDKIRYVVCMLVVAPLTRVTCSIWDWAQRKAIGVFSNSNPPSTVISSLRFINDDTDGLVVAGSCKPSFVTLSTLDLLNSMQLTALFVYIDIAMNLAKVVLFRWSPHSALCLLLFL